MDEPVVADNDPAPQEVEPRRGVLQILVLGLLVLGTVASALYTGLYLTGGLHDPRDWVVEGVSLGMTPAEVKANFKEGAHGDWLDKTGCDGLAYEWKRKTEGPAPASGITWARMEFHDGLLVAYRVKLDHHTRKRLVEVMSAAVREERATPEGETITILSRSCPSHQAEAEQLAIPHS